MEFDPAHPRSDRYIQQLATKKSQVLTVTCNGQLSQIQAEEDTVRGGHAETEAIRNDITLCHGTAYRFFSNNMLLHMM